MTKQWGYKLALLGCVSSCLMSVASANNSRDVIEFTKLGPDIRNVACYADKRTETYTIRNYSNSNFTVSDIRIHINSNDSWHNVTDVVSLVEPSSNNHRACDINGPFRLKPGEACEIEVSIDPQVQDVCGNTSSQYPATGTIDRTIEVTYDGPYHHAFEDIRFDFTYLGSGDSIALLGQNIYNDEYQLASDIELAGVVQVYEDVVITKPFGRLTRDIHYNDDSRPYLAYSTISINAFSDLSAAYARLLDTYNTSTCSQLPDQLGGQVLTQSETTTYCLSNHATPPFAINGTVTFVNRSTDPTYFIIVAQQADEWGTGLWIDAPSDYVFENSGVHSVKPTAADIIWLVDGDVRMQPGGRFAGSLLIKNGSFIAEHEPGTPAQIDGAIYSLNHNVSLNGNTINSPYYY